MKDFKNDIEGLTAGNRTAGFRGSIQEEEEGYSTLGGASGGDRISTFRTEMMTKDGGFGTRQQTVEMPVRQSPVGAFSQG